MSITYRYGFAATVGATLAALLAAGGAGTAAVASTAGATVAGARDTAAVPARTERVSVSRTGGATNNYSNSPAISADGRYVAYATAASNVVAGDAGATWDVVVRDRARRTNTLVSASSSGRRGNGVSNQPSINANGRFVVFHSRATNLVAGDTNARTDVFVRDVALRTTTRVSVGHVGQQANQDSSYAAISATGRFVVFASRASNLVPGDTNLVTDLFVRDLVLRRTERVSVATGGGQLQSPSSNPAISSDGRYVSFTTSQRSLVPGGGNGYAQVFVRDRAAGRTLWVRTTPAGQPNGHAASTSISWTGRFVVFESSATNHVAGDTNRLRDVFITDRATGRTERVNVSSRGAQANATSLRLPFRHPVSADGRYVAFESAASTLVAGDTNARGDVFVRDRVARVTQRVSVSTRGGQGNNGSFMPAMGYSGRFVAFATAASNLVAGDGRNGDDVLLRDRGA